MTDRTTRPSVRPGRPVEEAIPAPDLSRLTLAVVGLGTMGGGMAERIAETGAVLRVHNRTAGRARAGLTVAATPEEAARGADVVLVSVADDAALRAVLTGPQGVFAARPNLVVNATTVAPEAVRKLADRGPLIDAGVVGNGHHARSGLLRWYVGGPDPLVRRAEPVLRALGRQVLHVGALGSGMSLKLIMNMIMGVEMQALAEAIGLGEAAGLDRRTVLDAVTGSGFAAPVMRFKAERMTRRSYESPDFRLRLMAKDLTLAVGEAERHGVVLPMAGAAAGSHEEAVRRGHGDDDCAAVAEIFAAGPVGAEWGGQT
ncbi:NAD(P)-dependent oxidoreductase [Micromonospora carbonacea]|uniref:NAD(P)-dependent oxidoreductase n=1 Tax=Micromonospora carbonacea TaxID=47853 RepID=UPI0037156AF8